MEGTFKGFQSYSQSIPGGIMQGVKGGAKPKNALYGGNGSFRMKGIPPTVKAAVQVGDQEFIYDVYSVIKENSNRRVTEKYARQVCNGAAGATIEVNDNGTPIFRSIVEAIAPHCE